MEREKALNVKERISYEYNKARAKIEDPKALEKLQAHTQSQINAETKKLEDKLSQVQSEVDKVLKTKASDFNIKDEIKKVTDDLAENFEREKQKFLSLTSDDVFDLAKQYGPQLLAYLKYKYGPKPSYDKYVTEQDLQNYKSFSPQATPYPVKKKSNALLYGSIAAVGAYIALSE